MATVVPQGRPWPDPEPPDLIVPDGLRRERFPAMGTTVSVLLPERYAAVGAAAVRTLFRVWEETFSRFIAHSELSLLNRRAGSAVSVSPLLCDVLCTALEAARATDGLYDPTLLRQLEQLGYDRSFDALPEAIPTVAFPVAPGGGWRRVQVDRARRSVTLPAGVGVDLGGIAKGLAVDAALTRLRVTGAEAALINAGGDLATYGLPPGEEAWSIAVPGRDGRWMVPLHHGAMATSGVARRHWRQGAHERHHLLDPRSGLPAQGGLWSVTVVAARCVQAEIAAKAAFILGAFEGARFLQERGLAGLLMHETGAWQTVGPWPAVGREDRP